MPTLYKCVYLEKSGVIYYDLAIELYLIYLKMK